MCDALQLITALLYWKRTDTMLLNEVKSYIPEQLPKVYQLLYKFKHNKEIIIFRTREEAEEWLMKIPR